nr:uncharacterized protein LOC132780523 [Anolis sagrei ordinatus]
MEAPASSYEKTKPTEAASSGAGSLRQRFENMAKTAEEDNQRRAEEERARRQAKEHQERQAAKEQQKKEENEEKHFEAIQRNEEPRHEDPAPKLPPGPVRIGREASLPPLPPTHQLDGPETEPSCEPEMFPDEEDDGIQFSGPASMPFSGPLAGSAPEESPSQFSWEKNASKLDNNQVQRPSLSQPSHADREESLDSDLMSRQERLDWRVRRSSRIPSKKEASVSCLSRQLSEAHTCPFCRRKICGHVDIVIDPFTFEEKAPVAEEEEGDEGDLEDIEAVLKELVAARQAKEIAANTVSATCPDPGFELPPVPPRTNLPRQKEMPLPNPDYQSDPSSDWIRSRPLPRLPPDGPSTSVPWDAPGPSPLLGAQQEPQNLSR